MSASVMRKICFITGNEKKLQEVLQIFEKLYNGALPFELSRLKVDLDELQGDRNFICKNKALQAFKIVNGPCIVEDTCLCFKAMGGLPGPYVKWFIEAVGPSGLYRMLQGFEDKSATAVCTIAYANKDGVVTIFSGETSGTIVNPTTKETFGWDSCFQPSGYDITYAHMTKEEKNLISHRIKAMKKLKEHLDLILNEHTTDVGN